jgi:hypothetical protein
MKDSLGSARLRAGLSAPSGAWRPCRAKGVYTHRTEYQIWRTVHPPRRASAS